MFDRRVGCAAGQERGGDVVVRGDEARIDSQRRFKVGQRPLRLIEAQENRRRRNRSMQ